MILVDTSVIVAWLDKQHPHHRACLAAIEHWAQRDKLAVSSVTYGELAAGGRTREAVDEDLKHFERIPLDANAGWRAGMAFRNYRRKGTDDPVLPDFFIRAQAAARNLPHLTNDRRRIKSFPDVDFEFVN
jgi:predicted nucleic acid-binding protein